MIVVDTNVICGVYLPSSRTDEIQALMLKDPDWVAPYLWRSEFRNVLWQYLRHDRISVSDAKRIADLAESRMRDREYWTPAGRVIDLSNESGCTAYDCEFISVAMDLRTQIVTLDKKVLKQFPSIAVSPEEFVGK